MVKYDYAVVVKSSVYVWCKMFEQSNSHEMQSYTSRGIRDILRWDSLLAHVTSESADGIAQLEECLVVGWNPTNAMKISG